MSKSHTKQHGPEEMGLRKLGQTGLKEIKGDDAAFSLLSVESFLFSQSQTQAKQAVALAQRGTESLQSWFSNLPLTFAFFCLEWHSTGRSLFQRLQSIPLLIHSFIQCLFVPLSAGTRERKVRKTRAFCLI